MSTTLNDTMAKAKDTMGCAMDSAKDKIGCAVDSAKDAMGSAKEETEHAMSSARGAVLDGIHAIGGFASMLRSLGVADVLGWVGLERRRSPLSAIALFGAGVAVGAGVGVLFAPMSGWNTRNMILSRVKSFQRNLQTGAKRTIENAEHKVEEIAGKAKETVKSAEQSIESKVVQKIDDAKEAIRGGSEQTPSNGMGQMPRNGMGQSSGSYSYGQGSTHRY